MDRTAGGFGRDVDPATGVGRRPTSRLGRLLVPCGVAPAVTALDPASLRARGFSALIIDLDNTLARWNDTVCAPEVRRWLEAVRQAGLGVCIVSNNGPERVRSFCAGLGAGLVWIAHAGKPARGAYLRALQQLGTDPGQVAVIGDQIFTDVFGGNRAGLFTVLVRPLGRHEFPATRLVRLVERVWLRRLQRWGALRAL